jgi:amino acid permease
MNNYYKIIIAIAIIILIFVILIFTMNSIDNNSKIMIFAFIAIIVIILFVLYNNNLTITENFVTCRFKNSAVSAGVLGAVIDFTGYKEKLYTYNAFLLVVLTSQGITDNTFYTMTDYIDTTTSISKRKILLNNNKIKEYENASEILKKSINDYYYLIIFIVFSIIILMFGMSLYLLYPNMLLNIFIFAVIPFLILVYFIVYKLHRSTRMIENKNYWASFNPSKTTLALL